MTTIPPDWREFLRLLRSQNTKFLLIGAHALAFHAEARLTEDLDIFVEASAENAARLRGALELFGFAGAATEAELATPDRVFMLGMKPWRIDILTGIAGVTFAEAWATRERVSFHGEELDIISRAMLIQNKRAAGRKKDRVDLLLLDDDPAG
jgi:predicted nucleotidyltransferase